MKDRPEPPKPPLERNYACTNFREDSVYREALAGVTSEVTNFEENRANTVAGNNISGEQPPCHD